MDIGQRLQIYQLPSHQAEDCQNIQVSREKRWCAQIKVTTICTCSLTDIISRNLSPICIASFLLSSSGADSLPQTHPAGGARPATGLRHAAGPKPGRSLTSHPGSGHARARKRACPGIPNERVPVVVHMGSAAIRQPAGRPRPFPDKRSDVGISEWMSEFVRRSAA